MTSGLIAVLVLLAVVVVMFAFNKPRMDAVALVAICALPFTGVVEISETLAGFSDPNIVLIAALFVIGECLVRTGVARQLGDWLIRQAGSSQVRLVTLLMIVVCGLGATMSSTAVTAIFIPVVLRICQRTGIPVGQLMMPLSTAALISGMTTLVATAPNLVVNSELVRRGFDGFGFFSFTPFGAPILVLAIAYMLTARHWLPKGESQAAAVRFSRPSMLEWVERYNLVDREYRLRVSVRSTVVGKRLESLDLRGSEGVSLVAIQRGRTFLQPAANTLLNAGDILFIHNFSSNPDVKTLQEKYGLDVLPLAGLQFTDHSQDIGMAEMFVPADSGLIGKTIVDSAIRSRFGFSVIGLRRGTVAIDQNLGAEPLRLGDTLLVIGPWRAIRNVQTIGGNDLFPLNLPTEVDDVLPVSGKSIYALLTLLMVVVCMATGILPNVHAALIGCLVMGALGCIDFESAYRSIDWKTLVLIVGMLPFSIALQRTGGVDLASDGLIWLTSGLGTHAVLAALFITTAMLGLFISNTATAVLMAPVSLSIADHLEASPYPFAMIVALAASTAFMTPVSSPVNTLVVTPGNYRFMDFVRVGTPFAVVVMLVSVLLVPLLLPI
ncbi:SLC13 family permease [Planctomicrobium sp. SH527]|uniref:SLC13 family permease n=1 Tax=Planctomicrobium sp. SH527 TaxID=3448123 RepID=UPI003F5B34B9